MTFSKGFTLAELAIAMVIIALLLAGSMLPLSAQIDIRNISDTQRTMDGVKEAIIGYAQANGHLPCPADGTIASGGAGAGSEQRTGSTCTNPFGVVPWATLGVPETDSWGRRFSYWISPTFANTSNASPYGCSTAPTPPPTQAAFALCSIGILTVNTRSDTNHAAVTALGSVLPAVIISHGKNGYGAYTSGGVMLPVPSGGDELVNATHTSAATTFYSRTQTPSASGCNDAAGTLFCEFDDIVVMISAPTLNTRMIAAGKLP
jgi:prepilin-type N-terminal cleavage/methylation domain-containing protein